MNDIEKSLERFGEVNILCLGKMQLKKNQIKIKFNKMFTDAYIPKKLSLQNRENNFIEGGNGNKSPHPSRRKKK